MSLKADFLKYLGQTSPGPMGIEVDHAQGCYIYGPSGEKYLDLISGFSVSNIGHGHPEVLKAIEKQSKRYLHTMVYGEYVQAPQIEYARLLTQNLPESLNTVFFVSTGSEAIEGALKLAKRHTKRSEIISFTNAYHGSSHGALSIMGSEKYKTAFRPLLPDTRLIPFNDKKSLEKISNKTAAVVVEPIQAEAGIIEPANDFLKELRDRCSETGCLLILDEIQTGFGRTGSLFAFEQFDIVPDILVLAKALGGGLPLGAFIASATLMSDLSHDPVLGHLTTFGGHPLSCATGMAALQVILKQNLVNNAKDQGTFILQNLHHQNITNRRGKGLLLGFELRTPDMLQKFFTTCASFGFLFDLFLFNDLTFRVAPPLIINREETIDLIGRINRSLDAL